MKLKYILSMIAGLVTLAVTSCKEDTTANAGAADDKSVAAASTVVVEDAGAYYVMFKGDGSWGVGMKASSAFDTIEGIDSVVLSGLRATITMKDGGTLPVAEISKALSAKGLEFSSQEVVAEDKPVAVYVLNVAGVGWSESEEKARAALNEYDNVTNVYVGEKTELWLSKDEAPDKDALMATIEAAGFELEGISKADKSMY